MKNWLYLYQCHWLLLQYPELEQAMEMCSVEQLSIPPENIDAIHREIDRLLIQPEKTLPKENREDLLRYIYQQFSILYDNWDYQYHPRHSVYPANPILQKNWEYSVHDGRIEQVLDESGGCMRVCFDAVDASSHQQDEEIRVMALDILFWGVPETAPAMLKEKLGESVTEFSLYQNWDGNYCIWINGLYFTFADAEWIEGELPEDFFELERDPLAEYQWIFDKESGESWPLLPMLTELYKAAKKAVYPRQLSEYAEAGSVGAALLAADGNIYTGVCIDTVCSMGFCAEHAAAAAMITAGESRIIAIAAVGQGGKIVPPCGRCREFLTCLSPYNASANVLLPDWRVCTLEELLPYDWKIPRIDK